MEDENKNGREDGLGKTTSGVDKVQELMEAEEEIKIFGRLSSIMRSPPIREKASSTGDLSGLEESGKKRKMRDSTTGTMEREISKRRENRTTAVVKDMLETITKYSQILDKLVEENPNTKREIKETIGKLKRVAETAKKPSIQVWLEDKKWEVAPKQGREVAVQTGQIERTRKISTGTQTYDAGEGTGEEISKLLWDRIETIEDFEGWEEILKEEWPAEAFKVTKMAEERVRWSSIEDDLVLVLKVGDEGSGLARAAADTCPIACALLKEGLEAGKVVYGSMNTRVRSREIEGEMQKGLRYTYIIPVSKEKLLHGREIYEETKECSSTVSWAGRKSINLVVQDGIDTDMIRKMAEGAFRGGIERVKIFPPPGAKKKGNEGVRRRGDDAKLPTERARKERQTEAIMVSQEGKSYSDMLRLIKEKVKTGSVAAQGIRTIRESREGKMVIVMEKKDKEAIKELKGELSSLRDVNMRMSGGRDVILLIKDMDGLTTKKDVEEVICKELGLRDVDWVTGDLRPYYGGNQAVTIKMVREHAEVLIRKGKLK